MANLPVFPPTAPGVNFYDIAWNELSIKLRCKVLNKAVLPWLETILQHWLPSTKYWPSLFYDFVANDPRSPAYSPRRIYIRGSGSWFSAEDDWTPQRLSHSTIVELAAYLFDLNAAQAVIKIEDLLRSAEPRRKL
jgi:hypothetical protein